MTESDPEAEGQRRDDEGHEDYGEHTHDGDLSKGVKGWMTGYDEGADANEHDERREHDRPSIGGEHGTMVFVLIERALCHEDGIVVALAKDEGAQDDVDDIELNAQQRHDAQYPQPTDGHRQEGQQRQRQTAERGPEEEEHDAGTRPAYVVKVVGEMGGDGGEEGGLSRGGIRGKRKEERGRRNV